MIKTIGEGWESFKEDVISKVFPDVPGLYDTFQRCFYSGAMVFCQTAAEGTPEEITTLCFELQTTMAELSGLRPEDFDA